VLEQIVKPGGLALLREASDAMGRVHFAEALVYRALADNLRRAP